MTRTSLVLSSLPLLLLAACVTHDPVQPAPAPVVVAPSAPAAGAVVVPPVAAGSVIVAPAPGPLRAGFGRIDSITPIPASAASGATSPRPDKRVGLRMDDGTVQYVDTAAVGLSVGQRVEIMSDGRMRHPV
jgi:hypothetical protein